MTTTDSHSIANRSRLAAAVLGLTCCMLSSCDGGLHPPDEPATGSIEGTIRYEGEWPPASKVRDLRFVAMRFVPTDTADFLQLNRMVISNRLRYRIATDTFRIPDAQTGMYPYSGVALKFGGDLLDWKPIGIYDQNGGVFTVEPGRTTHLEVLVNFANPPEFPPER